MANPVIYERLISSGTASGSLEKGVRISNGCFSRTFSESGSHTRIGIRYRLYDNNGKGLTSLVGSPRFFIGFCNGTDSIPGDYEFNNFVGLGTTDDTAVINGTVYWQFFFNASYNMNVWTSSYTPPETTYDMAINNYGRTTWCLNTAFYIVNTTSSCDALFFDIIKKSGVPDVYSYKIWGRTANSGIEYLSYTDFYTQLQVASPSRTSYTLVDGSAQYFSSSAASYPLNSVCVFWNRTDPVIEILDLYVVRL